jgi:hypothetical protein
MSFSKADADAWKAALPAFSLHGGIAVRSLQLPHDHSADSPETCDRLSKLFAGPRGIVV